MFSLLPIFVQWLMLRETSSVLTKVLDKFEILA